MTSEILVIDDNPDIRNLITALFREGMGNILFVFQTPGNKIS